MTGTLTRFDLLFICLDEQPKLVNLFLCAITGALCVFFLLLLLFLRTASAFNSIHCGTEIKANKYDREKI